jgi:hypothetical protein
MIPRFYVVSVVTLMALSACAPKQHPVERYLSDLRPIKVVQMENAGWAKGTIICPLTPYQNGINESAVVAKRVNDFLKRKNFVGDEFHWSLIALNPASGDDAGIEHLVFKIGGYDVINEKDVLEKSAETLPEEFQPQVCVTVEQARVLVTRTRSQRTLISFGTE